MYQSKTIGLTKFLPYHSFAESLDLSSVPKQIRSCLYGCLKKFSNVKYLNMGSGHGGWLSETFCNRFYGLGMEHFTHLVILHFHHDCTDYLLNVIAQNNSQTLRILDFSFSQSVTDSSVQSIVKCGFLQEIDLLGKEWITDLGSLIGNVDKPQCGNLAISCL